ncbi:acyl-CoA carboxylase subunit beta [Brevibacillus centrosporus]|uniref:acyl-CoA carboxylase subunit beta n=1 Tax=Brevibacillus centrosporus TaxID=54910 RepID=UPI003D1A5AE1
MHNPNQKLKDEIERIRQGGDAKYHQNLEAQDKMFVRKRLELLFDADSIVEDGLFANAQAPDLPADATVTGMATIDGRPVCFMASDSTVKAGSFGRRTVEKQICIQEKAMELNEPILYLIDSAGGRITDQIEMFPGRRHGGRLFYNQVQLSGIVPQICILFGPSPAGSAYIPAFCDLTIMVEKNASAYLGSPRMVEMAIGEKTTMENMGGARMHCSVSGLGDVLVQSEEEAIAACKRYLSYMPQSWREKPPVTERREPVAGRPLAEIVPENQNVPFDMKELIMQIIDQNTWFEVKKLWAQEIITGLARMGGKAVGIVANQSKVKGGTLFVDSADKGARFIWLCNAFQIPLLFLSDVPGFMIGSQVERQGIIRHGAKMLSAVSEATVPKLSVIVRKCYGAGLYAMAGPAFGTDATIALPSASIAVMGPEAAINAVYYNKIMSLPEAERADFIAQKRQEYAEDIDIYRLGSELVIDDIIPYERLRSDVIARFKLYQNKQPVVYPKRNAIHPV